MFYYRILTKVDCTYYSSYCVLQLNSFAIAMYHNEQTVSQALDLELALGPSLVLPKNTELTDQL